MLPGQAVQDAVEDEAFRLDFGASLGDAHLVLFADGDRRVFLAELDEDEAGAGLESTADATKHLPRAGELVVHIDEQSEVQRFRGQAGVGFGAEDDVHVGEPPPADAVFQQTDHPGLDAEPLNRERGALFRLAPGALQPVEAGSAHNRCDETAGDGVAERLRGGGGGEQGKKKRGELRQRAGYDMFHTDTDSEARRMYAAFRGIFGVAAAGLILWSAAACGTRKADAVHAMGTPVTVGDLSYTVFNTEWRDELQSEMGPRKPQHRFLLVTVSVTNNGPEDAIAPLLAVIDKDGRETLEQDKGDGVAQWMGLLRRVKSTQTETGALLFDVPPGDYTLRVSSGGDVDQERTALIRLPYRVEAPESRPAVEPQMPPAQ